MGLADDLRARREQWHTVGGFEFRLRRPRSLDIAQWTEQGGNAELLLRSITDWRGVTVGDVTGGAKDDAPAPFEPELAREWLPDRMDLFMPLWTKLQAMIVEHRGAREEAAKN